MTIIPADRDLTSWQSKLQCPWMTRESMFHSKRCEEGLCRADSAERRPSDPSIPDGKDGDLVPEVFHL